MKIRRLKRMTQRVFYSALCILIGWGMAFFIKDGIPVANAAITSARSVISAQNFELVDKSGRRVILITTTSENNPGIWFFDRNGKIRLNLGLYEDGNPFVVLNDGNELAAQILRTVGAKNAPVLVQKSQGQDRVILGLDFATVQNPFFVYEGKNKKNTVFGNYP